MTDVSYELTGRIARVTLDRPAKLNAFTDDMVAELRSAFDRFDDDDEAWCAIVSGNGRAFSSGADVRQRQDRTSDEIAKLGGLHARGASIRGVLAGQIDPGVNSPGRHRWHLTGIGCRGPGRLGIGNGRPQRGCLRRLEQVGRGRDQGPGRGHLDRPCWRRHA